MDNQTPISFCDNVRVLETPLTKQLGLAGLIGNVCGQSIPSETKLDVIGELKQDIAFNVYFEDRKQSYWFAEQLLEFLDHAAGTEIRLKGIPKKWIREQSGEWKEISDRPSSPGFFQRLLNLLKNKLG